jgi:phosphoglycerate dehydrogenase-like enzyme
MEKRQQGVAQNRLVSYFPRAGQPQIIMSNSDFGLIGLAVMGQNLVLNVESRGFQVSVYNRTTSAMQEFVAKHPD